MTDQGVPPPPEGLDDGPSWATDDKARLEEKNWTDERKLRQAISDSGILWLKILRYIVAALMVFFTLIFMLALGAWVIHYTTPWCWLTPDQLSKIQSVIFSSTLGAVVSTYAQRQVGAHCPNSN
jgi:hypothetical protein